MDSLYSRIRGKRESLREDNLILERRVETCSPYWSRMNIKVTVHHCSFDQLKVKVKETGFHVYDDRNLGWACLIPGDTNILDLSLGYLNEDRVTLDLEVTLDTSYAHYFTPRIHPINVKPIEPKYELSAKLFMNYSMSDVIFRVKNASCSHDFQLTRCKSDEVNANEGRNFTLFPAHRMLLLEESPALVALIDESSNSRVSSQLNGNGSPTTDEKVDVACTSSKSITLDDTNSHAFYTLLRLIYTGTLIINPFNVYTTLDTLTRYLEPNKLSFVYDAIKKTSVNFVILDLYIYAFDFNNSTLLNLAYELMDENAESILPSDTFYHLPHDLAMNIVKRPSLRVTEITLFNCLVKWSRVQCQKQGYPLSSDNQRRVLRDLLSYIQFNCMTTTEFAMGPLRSNLLTAEEISAVSMSKVSLGKAKESTLMKRSTHPSWIPGDSGKNQHDQRKE